MTSRGKLLGKVLRDVRTLQPLVDKIRRLELAMLTVKIELRQTAYYFLNHSHLRAAMSHSWLATLREMGLESGQSLYTFLSPIEGFDAIEEFLNQAIYRLSKQAPVMVRKLVICEQYEKLEKMEGPIESLLTLCCGFRASARSTKERLHSQIHLIKSQMHKAMLELNRYIAEDLAKSVVELKSCPKGK